MLIKRIQNSRLLQLITAIVLLAIVSLLVFIINIIPIYNPVRVDINHTGLITPSGRNMALFENEVYFFSQGSEGRGIYVSNVDSDDAELVYAVERINGLAVNQDSVFFVTEEEDDFGAIVRIDKSTKEEVTRTIPLRYVMGIASDNLYVYFQACVTDENSCNSVSGLLLSNFVQTVNEADEVVPVDNFRIFKSDLTNHDNPAFFFSSFFTVVNIDSTNNRQVAFYYSSEIPGKTIVYQATRNDDTSSNGLYPYLIDQVDIFDNSTGLKVLASTNNDYQFRVSSTRYITRLRDFNNIVDNVLINEFRLNQISGSTETRSFVSVPYVNKYPDLVPVPQFNPIYFEFSSPVKLSGTRIGFIASRWQRPSQGSVFEPLQRLHLEDYFVILDYSANTLEVAFASDKGERIVGYREGMLYLYDKNKIYSYDLVSQERELVLTVPGFSLNTTITIDMMGKIILISNSEGNRTYRYDLP